MGRSASHILECALATHPNACLVSEGIEAKGSSLHDQNNWRNAIIKRVMQVLITELS